jgi:hypothetical protein
VHFLLYCRTAKATTDHTPVLGTTSETVTFQREIKVPRKGLLSDSYIHVMREASDNGEHPESQTLTQIFLRKQFSYAPNETYTSASLNTETGHKDACTTKNIMR